MMLIVKDKQFCYPRIQSGLWQKWLKIQVFQENFFIVVVRNESGNMAKFSGVVKDKNLLGDSFRFILAGGLNTLLTLGVYQLCIFFVSHKPAYAMSWLVGILYLIIVYPNKVFSGGYFSLKRSGAAIIVYIGVFFLSLWVLEQVVNLGVHERLAIFAGLCVSATLNFVLLRIVYKWRVL